MATKTPSGAIVDEETGQLVQAPPDSSVITGADLGTTQSLQLPQTPQEPNFQSVISSIPLPDLSVFQTPTQAETGQDDLSKRILEITERLGGRQATQAKAEETAGVPQLRTQLTDITNQLQSLQKEAAAIPLQLQEQATGRGITEGGLAPIQAGELRKNAIKALGLSAIGQTLANNLQLAQSQADRAVDLEYGEEESKLNFLKTAYEMNRDRLEREDKKRATALQVQLAERERLLEEQKDNRKRAYDVMLQAAQFGADTPTLNRIRAARSPEEAISIAGTYLGEEFRQKLKQQQFDRELKRTELNLSIEKFNEDIRQFGLAYAQKQQELELKKIIEDAKNSGDGAKVLKQSALESAKELLRKVQEREGTLALGGTRILGTQYLPGTAPRNFAVQFNNLKSLLSLDNVKLLKGQGQVSDAERRLLSEASAKLELGQSQPEFETALNGIVRALSGATGIEESSLSDEEAYKLYLQKLGQ